MFLPVILGFPDCSCQLASGEDVPYAAGWLPILGHMLTAWEYGKDMDMEGLDVAQTLRTIDSLVFNYTKGLCLWMPMGFKHSFSTIYRYNWFELFSYIYIQSLWMNLYLGWPYDDAVPQALLQWSAFALPCEDSQKLLVGRWGMDVQEKQKLDIFAAEGWLAREVGSKSYRGQSISSEAKTIWDNALGCTTWLPLFAVKHWWLKR